MNIFAERLIWHPEIVSASDVSNLARDWRNSNDADTAENKEYNLLIKTIVRRAEEGALYLNLSDYIHTHSTLRDHWIGVRTRLEAKGFKFEVARRGGVMEFGGVATITWNPISKKHP